MEVLRYMDFGEQIKKIRKKENLTQEQFAVKLNVSGQALSNWENNKNLPDIGMLILMSDVFQISLDQLIKGDNQMDNVTEKVNRDGSETRRSRYNMVSFAIGAALLWTGIILLVVKSLSVEYGDAAGVLHENVFLLPLGFLCIFCGMIAFAAAGIRALIGRRKNSARERHILRQAVTWKKVRRLRSSCRTQANFRREDRRCGLCEAVPCRF